MSNLLVGLVAALLSTNQIAAATAVVEDQTGIALPTQKARGGTNDPVEAEFQKLMEDDEAALERTEQLIQESLAFKAQGAGEKAEELADRVDRSLDDIRHRYEGFIARHPKHVEARLAYGSFHSETGREEEAVVQWEKALELDPKNPASWNNLANHYGHRGPVKKAFEYYEKAISLNTNEPVYVQNLATTTYLFRKDAKEHYNIDEQQVFDRAIVLYRKARALDPQNFLVAADYAQTYYGIKPLRTTDALAAWNYALKVANNDLEREGVYLHLARVELNSGMFDEARAHLKLVKHPELEDLKARVARNVREKEDRAKEGKGPKTEEAK